jgi:uncharacterized Zn-binding protein involved in type VI secretion
MSNTVLTADIIAAEALDILEGNLVMAKLVHRAHESEFGKKINGYTPGDTISIRRPDDATVRDGAVFVAQDVVEGKVTLTIDKQKGTDFKFTSADLTMKIDDLSERVIKPRMIQLANQVDLDLMALYKKVNNHVTIPSGGIDSFADFALAPTRMDTCAFPQDGRAAVLSPADHWALLGSQTGLYMQDVAKGAYRNAKLGMIGGVDTYMSQNVPTHTTGSRAAASDVVSAAFTGDTWAATKNTNQSTISVGTLSGATVTLAAGDTFTIADVYDVHPVTKAALPHLKNFVVVNAETASGSAVASLEVSPAIIPSGAQATVAFASGVTDINGKAITFQGAASTAYTQNLFFHKNAFALCMVPMEKPPGATDVARKSTNGISVRVIPFYDGINDVSNWRLDILYGVKCIDPRLAVRASLAANI